MSGFTFQDKKWVISINKFYQGSNLGKSMWDLPVVYVQVHIYLEENGYVTAIFLAVLHARQLHFFL